MKSEYVALTKIVNDRLRESNLKEVVFEVFEGVQYNILSFPKSHLLSIQDDKIFLHEAYYKVLDRPIDEPTLNHLYHHLQKKNIDKAKVLENLSNSKEREIKKTNLID